MLNLPEDVQALFAEYQLAYWEGVQSQTLPNGYQIVRTQRIRSTEYKKRHAMASARLRDQKIRERLLAGEKPKPWAKRWFKIIKEMGL